MIFNTSKISVELTEKEKENLEKAIEILSIIDDRMDYGDVISCNNIGIVATDFEDFIKL